MGKADKARMSKLKDREDDATCCGHGIFECNPDVQAKICELIMNDLQAQAREFAEGIEAEVKAKSREDVLIAMSRQRIAVSDSFREQYQAAVTAYQNKKAQMQNNAAASRRKREEKRQKQRDFDMWQSERHKIDRSLKNSSPTTPGSQEHNDDNR